MDVWLFRMSSPSRTLTLQPHICKDNTWKSRSVSGSYIKHIELVQKLCVSQPAADRILYCRAHVFRDTYAIPCAIWRVTSLWRLWCRRANTATSGNYSPVIQPKVTHQNRHVYLQIAWRICWLGQFLWNTQLSLSSKVGSTRNGVRK